MHVTEELKPCPFCGGSTRFQKWETAHVPTKASWSVTCPAFCVGLGKVFDDEDGDGRQEAAKAWNRRAALPQEPVAVKPLEWVDEDGWSQAHGYRVEAGDNGRFYARSNFASGLYATFQFAGSMDDAKAAAQADHEHRIRSALASPPPSPEPSEEDRAAFKNFHRLLCERFDYCHDPKDWVRDQISLIEHIAKRVRPSEPSEEDDLVAELICTLEELNDHLGDSMDDARANRIAQLSALRTERARAGGGK